MRIRTLLTGVTECSKSKTTGFCTLGLVKKLGFVLAPARTRLARKQNAGLLLGSPSFADTASRSRSQPKMEDNLFTSPYNPAIT